MHGILVSFPFKGWARSPDLIYVINFSMLKLGVLFYLYFILQNKVKIKNKDRSFYVSSKNK